MAQQGKQRRVGAREGFANHSVRLILLANGNRYAVDFNTFFLSSKATYPLEYFPVPALNYFCFS
jgi:hypothetical protein